MKTITGLIKKLIKNPNYAEKIRPIEIGVHQGKVWSFDTRRLFAFMSLRECLPFSH